MNLTHKPAAPLPWRVATFQGQVIEGRVDIGYGKFVVPHAQNAAYIVHSANAYPKLIEALRWYRAEVVALANQGRTSHASTKRADALLRELGEAV